MSPINSAILSMSLFRLRICFSQRGPNCAELPEWEPTILSHWLNPSNIIIFETLPPEHCLSKGFCDCPIRSRVFIKTQSFSIFVSGELLIRNLLVDGSDLKILEDCPHQITNYSTWCDQLSMSLDFTLNPCGLKNKPVITKPPESYSIIPVLFTLFVQDNLLEESVQAFQS